MMGAKWPERQLQWRGKNGGGLEEKSLTGIGMGAGREGADCVGLAVTIIRTLAFTLSEVRGKYWRVLAETYTLAGPSGG